MSPPLRLVRRDAPEREIVATLDQLTGLALLAGGALGAAGRLALEFAGETKVDWNSQQTVVRGGERLFVDQSGDVVGEASVALDGPTGAVGVLWRPPSDPVADAIEAMLVISTAHVSPGTLAALSAGAPGVAPHRVIPHEYGVVLFVGEPTDCAPDLAAPLQLARDRGCAWLNLDADAAELAGLPSYAYPAGA